MVVAKIAADVAGLVGVPLHLDGRASTGAADFRWEVLGAGAGAGSMVGAGPVTLDLADQAVAVLTATEPGTWVLRLTVTDAGGGSDAALTLVTAVAPTVRVEAPGEVSRWSAFTATATVPKELEGAACTWTTDPSEKVRVKPLPDGRSAVIVPRDLGTLTVTATVADPRGQTLATDSVRVSVSAPTAGDVSEAAYWQEQFLTDNRAALGTVRASATTWQGMLAGVLGLFGAITLLGAPGALDEVGSPVMAYLAVAMIAGAFLAAVAAVVLVTRIITPGVDVEGTPDPSTWGPRVLHAARRDTDRLARSKRLAFGAASLIAASGLVLAMAQLGGGGDGDGGDADEAPLALVRMTSATLCGPMSVDAGTGALSVAGQEVGATRSVEIVEACAAPAEGAAADEEDSAGSGVIVPSHFLGVLVAAVVVGFVLAVSQLFGRRRGAGLAAAIVFALAWGMSGQLLGLWHVVGAVVAAATAWRYRAVQNST